MMVTVHVVWGGVAGLISRPSTAFAAGVASHLALDTVPHWGLVPEDQWLRAAKVDGVMSLLMGACVVAAAPKGKRASVALGVAGAVFPDLDAPWRYVTGEYFFPKRVRSFLSSIQTESATQALVEVQALGAGVITFAAARAFIIKRGAGVLRGARTVRAVGAR